MTCERCWADAYKRARLLGGSQADHYRDLLKERESNPCPRDCAGFTPREEQP